jgi:hypothetical protein
MSAPGRPPSRSRVNHHEVAAVAKAAPGEWVLAGSYPSAYVARSVAWGVANGRAKQIRAYLPGGTFDAETRPAEFDTEVWVRYIGDRAAAVVPC